MIENSAKYDLNEFECHCDLGIKKNMYKTLRQYFPFEIASNTTSCTPMLDHFFLIDIERMFRTRTIMKYYISNDCYQRVHSAEVGVEFGNYGCLRGVEISIRTEYYDKEMGGMHETWLSRYGSYLVVNSEKKDSLEWAIMNMKRKKN